MNFEFSKINLRLQDFINYYKEDLRRDKDLDPNREHNKISEVCRNFDEEEKLYFILLLTHFDNFKTANLFYHELNWASLCLIQKHEIAQLCSSFFEKTRSIGDHRRYFNCLPVKENCKLTKAQYTIEILINYRDVISNFGSQEDFFLTGRDRRFRLLFDRLSQVKHFHTRLPRWDHLERLSYADNYLILPDRLYLEIPTYSGPISGLFYLLSGERNKADINGHNFITKILPNYWNSSVNLASHIPPDASFETIIPILENWLIDNLRIQIPPTEQRATFIYDIESCLCNWQKRKFE